MKKIGLLTLLCSLLSSHSWADGQYLLKRCQAAADGVATSNRDQRAATAYCFGLLQGVRELNALYQRKYPTEAYFCLGEEPISHSDNARLVVSYLNKNPSALQQNETVVAVRALREHYPCR